jgi:hypothetical protein
MSLFTFKFFYVFISFLKIRMYETVIWAVTPRAEHRLCFRMKYKGDGLTFLHRETEKIT